MEGNEWKPIRHGSCRLAAFGGPHAYQTTGIKANAIQTVLTSITVEEAPG